MLFGIRTSTKGTIMDAGGKSAMELVATTVQVISVVVGVVISVLSFNDTRSKEALARTIEAQKPFLELRQKLYLEALKQAAILATPNDHSAAELKAARSRFRELYVAELSMVEAPEVEGKMKALAGTIDPELTNFTDAQTAAYHLSHALRDSFVEDWNIKKR
jgi:hypothetical protein